MYTQTLTWRNAQERVLAYKVAYHARQVLTCPALPLCHRLEFLLAACAHQLAAGADFYETSNTAVWYEVSVVVALQRCWSRAIQVPAVVAACLKQGALIQHCRTQRSCRCWYRHGQGVVQQYWAVGLLDAYGYDGAATGNVIVAEHHRVVGYRIARGKEATVGWRQQIGATTRKKVHTGHRACSIRTLQVPDDVAGNKAATTHKLYRGLRLALTLFGAAANILVAHAGLVGFYTKGKLTGRDAMNLVVGNTSIRGVVAALSITT